MIASRIHCVAVSKRKMWPTCRINPRRSAISTSRNASADSSVIGFSTNTSLPASRNFLHSSKCEGAGVAITTASAMGLEGKRIGGKRRRFDAGFARQLQPIQRRVGDEQLHGQRARDPQMVGSPPAHAQNKTLTTYRPPNPCPLP